MNIAVFLKSFSKAIRENRIAAGMTQTELAVKANVSAATIKRVEAGSTCGLKEFSRILSVLNPKLVERMYQALTFDPLDFTQDAIQGIHLLSSVKTTQRVRGRDE